ncbi:rho GTPase-activating protein 7 isoform X2 [Takifugu rubripes]|uniref:rho GTPase-activating protein 7 isoform X2 n=1 Tax=Takifugu rubripes TaxID=31033 RepID=UPI0011454CEE|nr:rho GTPase-activating protein 7 isoform X2 [Takifugu rubripes]
MNVPASGVIWNLAPSRCSIERTKGSQYSYDDLDLICFHGVDVEGSWLGAESSRQGQRTRCASMPGGCHQLVTEEPSQTIREADTVLNDETNALKLMPNDVKVPLDLEESALGMYDLLDVDIPQRASESEYLQITNTRGHGDPHRNLNTCPSIQNGACEIARKKQNIGRDDNDFKCPHITHEEQQCISVPSNNEPLLSECAGEQPGKHPNHQQTMENYAEGYSRPLGTFDITLTQSSAAGARSPNDPPDAEAEKMSNPEQVDGRLMDRTHHLMENGDKMSQAGKAMEPLTILAECECGIESGSSDSTSNLDGLKPEPLSQNAGLKHNMKTCEEGKQSLHGCTVAADEMQGREISSETFLVPFNAAMTPHKDGAKQNKEGLRFGEEVSSFSLNKNVDTGNSGSAMETYLETTCARDDQGGSSMVSISACHETQSVAPQQFGNSCLQLDPIPEVSHSVLHDTPLHPSKNSNFTPNPDVQQSYMDDNYITAEKVSQNVPLCSAEDCAELSPKLLHSNQEASGWDSPGCGVADGYTGCTPAAKNSEMKAELADLLKNCDAQGYSLVGINQPGANGEGEVRTKKHERARLDSMVLLLIKLDQLDQEIQNALSTTSSMYSSPTLQRRPPRDFTLATVPPNRQNVTCTSGASAALGAKPKCGGGSNIPEKEKAEIEAKEACTWLRAAGFPQYAQLYEDAQFPIDISSVTRDHDFLDRDAIEALCRRLNTLNKCALMRLEISPHRKRSEDSDEDEPCAISGRWTFQRESKRWSRMDELDVFSKVPTDATSALVLKDQVSQKGRAALQEGNSSESVLTDLSEQPEVGSIHSSGSGGRMGEKNHCVTLTNEAVPAARASSVASMCSSSCTGGSGGAIEDYLSDGMPPSPLETFGQFTFDDKTGAGGIGGSLDRGGGKSTRSRAKSFLKRMESLRLRAGTTSKRKKKGSSTGGKIEISGPVIKEGLDDDKLRRLNCVDISSINLNQNFNHNRNPTQTMTLNRNRSISYSTQTSNRSTGSTTSSQSEASSGSAVSTPSPVTRARSHSTAASSTKRGGMYLEGFDPFSIPQIGAEHLAAPAPKAAPSTPSKESNNMTINEQNCRNNLSIQDSTRLGEDEEEHMIFFYLPEGHKPGTFPKALQDGNALCNNRNTNGNSVILRRQQNRRQRSGSSGSVDSRVSFYDNVPHVERDEEEEGDEQKLDQVLQHVSGLQRFVNAWSEAVTAEEEEEEEEGDSDSALDSASPCPSSPLQNRLEETENGSDQDSTGNPLGENEEGMRDRRDSGVGASLTRTSRPQKLRWPSFQNSHQPSSASAPLQISCQSVLQMNLLQKLSLLQLTALLEKHTPTNKQGFSWAVPKFMKRIKVPDYKDRNVFGVPLQVIVQRTGQPLPQGIQQAMRYLRGHCLDQVGLFRKSGVKSRIQTLRQMNEASGTDGAVNYEGQSAYDVADMLKQYFRDLPEPLLSSKLSETFLQIYQYMPKELHLQAVRAAVLLLPDENREALQTLLCLLSDVTASVAENQMTPTNLAVCLAPSLFHLNTLRKKESSSPRVMNRKQTLGKPDQRDLNENLAATHGLAHMIQECGKLFRIPEEMNHCRNSYMEQALLPRSLEDLVGEKTSLGATRSFLQDSLDTLLKEAKEKFKGYDSCPTPEQAELACRKLHDGFPLRLWKVTVEIPASPEDVLTRVLREQGHWDEDLLECRTVETLNDRTDIYQYVRNTMAPHPTRDHVVLRTWLTDLPKGACVLVCTSVDHSTVAAVGVRANILLSRYYIEPCGGNKSRLTHISRIDCRGRFPEWYNKMYGHLCAAEAARIRDSFTLPVEK